MKEEDLMESAETLAPPALDSNWGKLCGMTRREIEAYVDNDMAWKWGPGDRGPFYKSKSKMKHLVLTKDSRVKFGNTDFGFASEAAVRSETMTEAKRVGLDVMQWSPGVSDDEVTVVTHVGHESGVYLEVVCSVPIKSGNFDIKEFGQLMTYIGRYQLKAIFMISIQDEDEEAIHMGPVYSGSPTDKKWLVENLKGLPYKLDAKQLKELSADLIKGRVTMTLENITKTIEEKAK